MIKGVIELLARLAIVWIPAWTVICCGCIPAMERGEANWEGIRFVLWIAAIISGYWEVQHLNRQFRVRTEALRSAGRPIPPRLDQRAHGCLPLILLGSLVTGILLIRFIATPTAVNFGEWIVLFLIASLVAQLLGGAWSKLRFALATRSLQVATHRRPAPLVAAVLLICIAGLLLVRTPRAGVVRLGAVAATHGLLSAAGANGDQDIEMIVELGPDDHIGELEPILRRYGAYADRAAPHARVATAPEAARSWRVRAPAFNAPMLALELSIDAENVDAVEVNLPVPAMGAALGGACVSTGWPLSNDPLSAAQTPLQVIGADLLLRNPARLAPWQTPVRIAVLDDGVWPEHEDLYGIVEHPSEYPGEHGTAVAGIAAARTHNSRGIASLSGSYAPFEVLDFQVLGDDPAFDDIADAIIEAADEGAAVIILAMESPGSAPRLVRHAAADAQRRGVVLVAAAGNNGGRALDRWPANLPGVLVVTAGDGSRRESFSASGEGVRAIAAPGRDICSPRLDGGYQYATGTSMSAAIVGGAVAMYAARCPDSTPEERISAVLAATLSQPMGNSEPLLRVDLLAQSACPTRRYR